MAETIRLPDEMCAEDAVAIYKVMAERDRYRAALERIAETPFSPGSGWRHWRLIAKTALREDSADG
jgi:hypothetical protein